MVTGHTLTHTHTQVTHTHFNNNNNKNTFPRLFYSIKILFFISSSTLLYGFGLGDENEKHTKKKTTTTRENVFMLKNPVHTKQFSKLWVRWWRQWAHRFSPWIFLVFYFVVVAFDFLISFHYQHRQLLPGVYTRRCLSRFILFYFILFFPLFCLKQRNYN